MSCKYMFEFNDNPKISHTRFVKRLNLKRIRLKILHIILSIDRATRFGISILVARDGYI